MPILKKLKTLFISRKKNYDLRHGGSNLTWLNESTPLNGNKHIIIMHSIDYNMS